MGRTPFLSLFVVLCVFTGFPAAAQTGPCDYVQHEQTVSAIVRLKAVAQLGDARQFALLAEFPLHVRLDGRTQEVTFEVFQRRFKEIVGQDVLQAIRDTDPHRLTCRHGVIVLGNRRLSLQPVQHAKTPEGRDPGLFVVWITSGPEPSGAGDAGT
jgi:hypothetical protein